jgi:hypothetical protein
VLSWAGMRGVVTLAAAQSLPNGTPYRDQLILIAFVVAITTLLLQGSTLPLLIRLSGIRGSDATADREELVTLLEEIAKSGLEVLGDPDTELPSGGKVSREVIDRVRHDMELQLDVARERAEFGQGEDALDDSPHQQYRTLRQEVLAAERDALLEARSRGAYTSRVLSRAQVILDIEESRLAQLDNG